MNIAQLRQRYETAKQGHLFKRWHQLSEPEREALAEQLINLDIERVNRIYLTAIDAEKDAADSSKAERIDPLPVDLSDTTLNPSKVKEWEGIGMKAIANGEVAVLLMAGGQGTRLGSSAPKGCYDIGLPSHKSLFQYQAERILCLQRLAASREGKRAGSVIIPWYVMTSGPTRSDTEDFFKENKFFGLDPANVIFFEQGVLPCVSLDGKLLLKSPSELSLSPDGNGGVYAATRAPLSPTDKSRSVLSDLDARGVLYVHAYCVDNCLVRVADPAFIGYAIQKQADCAAKVVPKAAPSEAVGVVAHRGGKPSVVEYSEISKEQAEKRDSTGELSFRAGNIANHFYTTDFLKGVAAFENDLPFHIAMKKIPYLDLDTGEIIKPSKPNGIKLETFVFDVFPYTQRFTILEVVRNEEFSPLKNGSGTADSNPETSRSDLLAQHKRFLEAAGATVKEGVEIEISPLVSYAGEGLDSVKGKTFSKSGLVESVEELDALA